MQIIKVLQGEGGTINSLLAHVASLTNTLADRDQVIGRVIDNLNTVLGTIDERARRGQQADRRPAQLRQRRVRRPRGDLRLGGRDQRPDRHHAGAAPRRAPDLREDIAGLRKLTGTFDANRKDIDEGLQRTPNRLEKLVNISSYGSWFNMYICGLDARVRLPGGPVYQTPAIMNENARCK